VFADTVVISSRNANHSSYLRMQFQKLLAELHDEFYKVKQYQTCP
jgi:hypothetical protein